MSAKEVISVITCTGFRPEAFALCRSYMKRQTYKGKIQWIVVNDAYSKDEITDDLREAYPEFELYAAPVQWRRGLNTQRANMALALSKVKGEKVFFVEDDDFYKPDFLKVMSGLLNSAEIAGEGNSKYYNLGFPGWKENRNYSHSSLCQTGIRSSLVPKLIEALNSGNKYFDIALWSLVHKEHIPAIFVSEMDLCIGIKQMPGKPGIGSGHQFKGYFLDPDLSRFREWLGADAESYLPHIKRSTEQSGRDNGNRERSNGGLRTEEKRVVLPGAEERRVLEKPQQNRYDISPRQSGAINDNRPKGAV